IMMRIIILLLGIGMCFDSYAQLSKLDPKKKYSETVREMEEYFEDQVQKFGKSVLEGEGSEYRDFQRWKQFWQPRIAQGDGTMIDYMRDLNAAKEISRPSTRLFGNTDSWNEFGPNTEPLAGLSTIGGGARGTGIAHDIAFYRPNASHILTWSLAGGLFYSSNKGTTWINAGSDNWNSSGCSSADFAPDTLQNWYACSNLGGNYYNRIIGPFGGVLRTKNSGATWQVIADRTSFTDPNPVNNEDILINKILIDPYNSNIAYLATNKGLYKNTVVTGSNLSLVKSSWVLESSITGLTDYVDDMEFLPGTSTLVIAWKNSAGNWSIAYKPASTWTTLSAYPVVGSYLTSRLAIEVSDNAPNKLFLLNKTISGYYDPFNTQLSSYNFTTSTWTYLSSHHNQTGGIGFCVSNFDANIIYLAEELFFKKSNDGGLTWPASLGKPHDGATRIIHADVDKLATPPASCAACSLEVYIGTHGGISFSNDTCHTVSTRSNGLGLANGPMATSATNPEKIVMGLDHDGSVLSSGTWSTSWTPTWHTVNGGDGQFPAIDYSDPNYVWTSDQNINATWATYYLSSSGGGAGTYTQFLTFMSFPANNAFGQYIVQNKVNPQTVYYPSKDNSGGYLYENVFRSNNRGGYGGVEQISDFDAINIPTMTGTTWPDNLTHNYWIFSAIYPTSDANIMYVGLAINGAPWYGKAYRNDIIMNSNPATVRNAWVELTLPPGMVNPGLMAVDVSNPNIVYYAYRGFSWGSAQLWKADYSNISSPVFTNIAGNFLSGGLPGVSIQSIVTEKGSNGGIYVGTDVGIFYSNNAMIDWTGPNSQWVELGTNLPNLPIHNMEINYVVNKLRVSTCGRGVWEHDLYCPSYQSIGLAGPQNVDAYNEAVDQVVSSQQIANNVNVTHRGGTYVDLTVGIGANPGFEAVPSNSNYFEAFIHPCSYQYYNSPGIKQMDESVLFTLQEEEELDEEEKGIFSDAISIFPNPNTGELFVKLNEQGMRLEVYSILGAKLADYKLVEGQNKIDLGDVNPGQYIIKIYDNKNNLKQVEKIIRAN
ncbi:MAG TPA: T9SS type A sorting domain-containing protein, partial [Flavobacteriales bacterium]|nr:T9SS type A sorting domain-containing protein [Flavobacteriales bacterium]